MDLSMHNETYKKAETKAPTPNVPDGTYSALIERAALKMSRSSNRPMMEWEFVITGPNFKKKHVWKRVMLDDERQIPYLKGDLENCGLFLKKFSDLPKRIGELLDLDVEIYLKTKGEYQNVYINGLLSDEKIADEDDTPF